MPTSPSSGLLDIVERVLGQGQFSGNPEHDDGRILATILASDDPLDVATRLIVAAEEPASADEPDLRIRLLELALDVRRKSLGSADDPVLESLEKLADALRDDSRFNDARPLYTQALAIRESICGTDHVDLAATLNKLGRLESMANDFDAAEALFGRALAIRRKHFSDREPLIAENLNYLGVVHAQSGRHAQAAPLFEQVLAIKTEELGRSHPDLLKFLNNLAIAHFGLGQFRKVLEDCDRALALVETNFGVDDPRSIDPLANLSQAYLGLGRYKDAMSAAERAVALQTKTFGESHPNTPRMLASLAVALGELGELRRAQSLLERALDLLRSARIQDLIDIRNILFTLGLVRAELREFESARSLLEEALAIIPSSSVDPSGLINSLAVVHYALRNYDRALALHQESLGIQRRRFGEINRDVGRNLIEIGRLHSKRADTDVAIRAVLKGLAILFAVGEPSDLAWGYATLADIVDRHQRSARVFLRKLTVNITQGLRAELRGVGAGLERTFASRVEGDYRVLSGNLILSDRLPEAQRVLAMVKEQELFELTRGDLDVRTTRAALTPLEEIWRLRTDEIRHKVGESLRQAVEEQRNESGSEDVPEVPGLLDRATSQLTDWFDAMVADFSDIGLETGRVISSQIAKPSLWQSPPVGVALVQYLLASNDLGMIVTTAGGQRQHQVELTEGRINELVFEMRDKLQDRSLDFLESARGLHEILISPIAHELRSARIHTLALSLDGILRYLPIAALHDGSRYLIEEFALVLTASAGGERNGVGESSFLRAIGLGVSRKIAGYAPLFGVREELSGVIRAGDDGSGVLPGVIRLNEAFTAAALAEALAERSPIVHIASHFVFEPAQESSSYLLLGDGSRLTLAELVKMRFDGVDLIALSACDTATSGGHRQSGREIEGFGALVQRQGARNVLATLWPVADLTTAALMRTFYHNRYVAGLALPDALRRAQLSLLSGTIKSDPWVRTRGLLIPEEESEKEEGGARKSYAGPDHPFYWAPYILMGDLARAATV
jgi:CHAT domain-containing protein/tetratricopeptide (TPR) repeat protein